LCEDAYITFRTIDNWVNGHGLRWNPAERVQVYTHPLWMLILTAGRLVTGELYYATLAWSLILSAGVLVALAIGFAVSRVAGILAIVLLTGSRAFIDFSSSGLENPLTHLLLLGHAWALLRYAGPRRILWLTLTAALLASNRLDTILLTIPGMVMALRHEAPGTIARQLALGLSPLLLWELFALFYYGFAFPNTAFAKLGSGVATTDLAAQGFAYLVDSLWRDPLTLCTILGGWIVAWVAHRDALHRGLVVGAVLYLLYVVSIGGDFMSGRFLTPVLLVSVTLLSLAKMPQRVTVWALVAACCYLIAAPASPLYSDREYGAVAGADIVSGIADERGYYYRYTGLLRALGGQPVPDHPWARAGMAFADVVATGERRQPLQVGGAILIPSQGRTTVAIAGNVGFLGYFAGPKVHLVDLLALTDPLLARLPAYEDSSWRVGHFRRVLPAGYIETLSHGQPLFADVGVGHLYEQLCDITRGDLLDARRWQRLIGLNLQGPAAFVQASRYRHADRADILRTQATVHQSDAELHVELARAYLEKGRLVEAAPVLEHASMLATDRFTLQAQVGLLAAEHGLLTLARQACGRAVELASASRNGSPAMQRASPALQRCLEAAVTPKCLVQPGANPFPVERRWKRSYARLH
jgi:arabinofuranosyltransferase